MTVTQYKLCSKGLHEMVPGNIMLHRKTVGDKYYERCRECMRENKRKWRAGKSTYPKNPGAPVAKHGRACPHGVEFVRDCRECGRIRDREYRLRKKLKFAPEVVDMAKKTSLDYLKLSPEAGKASDRLNIAIDYTAARPLPCEVTQPMVNEDGEMFDGYPHVDFPDYAPPSVVEASLLCQGCPVSSFCLELGKAMRAKNMVMGGMLFDEKGKLVGGQK